MQITSLEQVSMVIMDAYADAKPTLDPELCQALNKLLATSSGTMRALRFVEVVYARMDETSQATRDSAADVALFLVPFNIGGIGTDGRGIKIAQVLRGETVQDAPEPIPAYVAPEPAPKPEPESD